MHGTCKLNILILRSARRKIVANAVLSHAKILFPDENTVFQKISVSKKCLNSIVYFNVLIRIVKLSGKELSRK